MLQFECPGCKVKIQAGDEHAGQQTVCPACRAASLKATESTSGKAVSAGSPPDDERVPSIRKFHNHGLFQIFLGFFLVWTAIALLVVCLVRSH